MGFLPSKFCDGYFEQKLTKSPGCIRLRIGHRVRPAPFIRPLDRTLRSLGGRRPWLPKDFSNPHFPRISASELVEEECLSDYLATRYYPVRIGELLASRYQVVGKLGFGVTSTVWLARDLTDCRHVALKIFIRSISLGPSRELLAYERLDRGPKSHLGRSAVRTVLNTFTISGPDDEHQCLVHPPLWDDMSAFLKRNPIGRLPVPVLAIMLQQVFRALDYARECRIIHTDIKASNIMFGIKDGSPVFEKFEQAELDHPVPRKEIDGRIIYLSRELDAPDSTEFDVPVLCDFGEAVWGEEMHTEIGQPPAYRSPEMFLGVPWSYEIDVWNVACVIWDVFEGRHLFNGIDPEKGVHRGRVLLASIIALLGPPPPSFLAQGSESSRVFSEQGQSPHLPFLTGSILTYVAPLGEWQGGVPVPPHVPLEELETNLEGADKKLFLEFMSKMLQWEPQNRQTPKQLLEDPWLKKHTRA
ncbi:kinase-like domain-containing protein [Mycena filopes]|nr:kinase-like domain-containing protein [Mycena filopes]